MPPDSLKLLECQRILSSLFAISISGPSPFVGGSGGLTETLSDFVIVLIIYSILLFFNLIVPDIFKYYCACPSVENLQSSNVSYHGSTSSRGSRVRIIGRTLLIFKSSPQLRSGHFVQVG